MGNISHHPLQQNGLSMRRRPKGSLSIHFLVPLGAPPPLPSTWNSSRRVSDPGKRVLSSVFFETKTWPVRPIDRFAPVSGGCKPGRGFSCCGLKLANVRLGSTPWPLGLDSLGPRAPQNSKATKRSRWYGRLALRMRPALWLTHGSLCDSLRPPAARTFSPTWTRMTRTRPPRSPRRRRRLLLRPLWR